ncbi:MAG TPA: hypothetical protein VHH73_06460 [Verrucomicrobiae bacterium]|nr:hypothetical protein [Verrucomicrobiae bacterium]
MGKAEISWKGQTEAGEKREVYVRPAGGKWLFFEREKRYDQWQALENPPLADWLELLDAVERRIARQLARPEESGRIRKIIKERFPDADLNTGSPE